jgi:hypothetical protein
MSKHRLSQVNAPVVQAQIFTLKALAEERQKVYSQLTAENTVFYQHVRKTFQVDDLKQIFLIKLKFSKDRGAMYSGCSPYCSVDSIMTAWTKEPSLSVYTFANNCFPMQYPCFIQNDLSSLRTARYDQESKQMVYARSMQNFSAFELLESFWGVIAGTLNNYIKDDDPKGFTIQLLSLAMISVHHCTCFGSGNDLFFMTSDQDRKEYSNFKVTNEEKKAIITEALNRDTQPEFARRLRQLSSVNKIRQFYRLYAEGAKENPELLHQSVWPRLEYFIFGLLLFPNDSPTQELLRDCILSAIFNRSIRAIPLLPKGISDLTDENDLIKFIFDHSSKIINSIRYFAFTVNFCLQFNAAGKLKSVSDIFPEQVHFMRQNILNCPSIQVLCRLISPKSGKDYTLENVADLFATIHDSDQKEKRFSTVTINSNKTTLRTILAKNTAAVIERQKELLKFKEAPAPAPSDPKDMKDTKKHERVSEDCFHIFSEFLDSHNEFEVKSKLLSNAIESLPTLTSSDNYRQICEFIIKHAVSGGIANAKMLIGVYFAFVGNPQHSFILTRKRFLKWVIWSSYNSTIPSENQSIVYKCFKVVSGNNRGLETDRVHAFRSKKLRWDNAIINKYGIASSFSVKESKESPLKDDVKEEKLSGVPIQLKPFEPSCMTLLKMLYSRGECVICFEANRVLVKLHEVSSSESVKHVVCSVCAGKIRESPNACCPFCRANI